MKKSDERRIIKETIAYVQGAMNPEHAGHDWWHTQNVYRNACAIARTERNANLFVISLAALLHDIADYKFHDGDITAGASVARAWLEKQPVDASTIDHVATIISNLSFKGAGVKSPMATIEGKIVQDADRLEAIGAVGIARVFAYGGSKGRAIHDPASKPVRHKSFASYKNNKSSSINHFFEKLLLLKDLMNTREGRKIATKRHKVMVTFLKTFFKECDPQSPLLKRLQS